MISQQLSEGECVWMQSIQGQTSVSCLKLKHVAGFNSLEVYKIN